MTESLEGSKELAIKLSNLERKLAAKTLRGAMLKATLPVVRQMRQKAPKGTVEHRTYKKRLVAPGFLSRSLRRKTRIDKTRGALVVTIGVRSEAFYGIQFYDQGPYTITKRRQSTKSRRRRHIDIKPYTLKRYPWFQSTFTANRSQMESAIVHELRSRIEKIKNGN